MTTQWQLDQLRDGVKINHPSRAKELISLINSLARSREIFDYHKCLARDAFEAFNVTNDPDGMSFANRIFGIEDDDGVLWQAGIVSEANFIACTTITRSSFDSFGQLVNQLMLTKPCKANPYVQEVAKALSHGELKEELSAAISSEWFAYIQAFSNTVKHRQLITHNPSLSFIDENRGGKVEGFDYKGHYHPACWVMEALEGTVQLQNSLVACGKALNRAYLCAIN
ncbi:hypothetical protein PS645_04173 [Pseudomonas fluorescens]|uniref:Uncharacterized protein n=1 Tax=Pseudomonas fluorescens TaxID=294 RepID=A0A5E6VL98_PSEFL|nr:hypothetical protein [Pseudomonas fluorescens]VVN18443.1 hypothetical protein PS645_04173 [Pseudomonas fluorescens]